MQRNSIRLLPQFTESSLKEILKTLREEEEAQYRAFATRRPSLDQQPSGSSTGFMWQPSADLIKNMQRFVNPALVGYKISQLMTSAKSQTIDANFEIYYGQMYMGRLDPIVTMRQGWQHRHIEIPNNYLFLNKVLQLKQMAAGYFNHLFVERIVRQLKETPMRYYLSRRQNTYSLDHICLPEKITEVLPAEMFKLLNIELIPPIIPLER